MHKLILNTGVWVNAFTSFISVGNGTIDGTSSSAGLNLRIRHEEASKI